MQKANEIKHRVTVPGRRYFPIMCLLVLGVAVSFAMFLLVHSWEQTNRRLEFESSAKAYTNAVQKRLDEYVGALMFLGDYFNNSEHITRKEFSGFVKSVLPRYTGIQAFGWNPLVNDDERNLYESTARKEGFDDFEFTERSETNKLVRAAQREEYVVVYYIHPMEGNRPAFGFDIASNPIRLKAITSGFITGKIAATDRITLVQETGNQFGILLLMPIYHQGAPLNTLQERRKSRKGFVVEVLRIGDAVETSLIGFSDEGICLTLYDMSADEGNRFLYHRPSRLSKTTDQPIPAAEIEKGLFWSKTIDFAERRWKIFLSPSDIYYQSRKIWQAWVVLFGSLLLTSRLAFYMLRKIQYTTEIEQRAEKQAQSNLQLQQEMGERKLTEEALRESEEKFRTIFHAERDAIMVFDAETFRFLEANDATLDLYGYTQEEFLKLTPVDISGEPEETHKHVKKIADHLLSGGVAKHERKHKRKDGTVFSAEISASTFTLNKRKMVCGIVRDITERSQAEAALRNSERRLADIINFLPDATFVIDREGKVIAWNRSIEDLSGIKSEDILGKGDYEYAIPFYGIRRPVLIDLVLNWDEEIAKKYKTVKKKGDTLFSETRNPPFRSEPSMFSNTARPLHNAHGDVVGAIEVIQDLTDRMLAEKALKEAYDIIRMSPAVAFLWRNEEGWPVEFVTDNVEALFGYTADEFVSRKVAYENVVYPDDLERVAGEVSTFSDEPGRKRFVHQPYRILTKNGQVKWVEDRSFIRRDKKGRITHYQGIVEDITERVRTEEEKTRLSAILEVTSDFVSTSTPDAQIMYLNRAGKKMIGWDVHENIDDKKINDAHPQWALDIVQNTGIPAAIRDGIWMGETALLKQDGSEIPVSQIIMSHKSPDGKLQYLSTNIRDITERKRHEDQIQSALKEKEVLLREIHHRVKNNMQVITSLLRLQSTKIKEKQYADMLKDSQSRIKSMALVHEKLYQSADFSEVDFNSYVKALVNSLFRSYGVNPTKIALRIEVDDVSLELDHAIPCGLIINELVSNALKYAFPEDRKGEVRVSLDSTMENEFKLTVSDNGIGMPEHIDFRNTESLGLHLVTILVEDQLLGKIELNRVGGTKYYIVFKKEHEKARI